VRPLPIVPIVLLPPLPKHQTRKVGGVRVKHPAPIANHTSLALHLETSDSSRILLPQRNSCVPSTSASDSEGSSASPIYSGGPTADIKSDRTPLV